MEDPKPKRNISDFVVHCTHSYRLNGDKRTEFVNFDVYDILRDNDIATKFKLAMVQHGLHSDAVGFYFKEITGGETDKRYMDVVNFVTSSFKEMVRSELVTVSVESQHNHSDRHSIFITKMSYE